jgi:hypothetical protein
MLMMALSLNSPTTETLVAQADVQVSAPADKTKVIDFRLSAIMHPVLIFRYSPPERPGRFTTFPDAATCPGNVPENLYGVSGVCLTGRLLKV